MVRHCVVKDEVLLVREGGYCLRELKEDLALDFPEANSFTTGCAAGAPLVDNETGDEVLVGKGREAGAIKLTGVCWGKS